MARLTVYDEQGSEKPKAISGVEEIKSELAKIGVKYEVWTPQVDVSPQDDSEAILKIFAAEIEQLKSERGFKTQDVIAMHPTHEAKDSLRKKFLSEHIHSDDEARYFVHGQGLFYVHKDSKVFGILCEKGDLINVPADTRHWFDMGPNPNFKCIRVFTDEAGWVAQFTGDAIADRFPRLEN